MRRRMLRDREGGLLFPLGGPAALTPAQGHSTASAAVVIAASAWSCRGHRLVQKLGFVATQKSAEEMTRDSEGGWLFPLGGIQRSLGAPPVYSNHRRSDNGWGLLQLRKTPGAGQCPGQERREPIVPGKNRGTFPRRAATLQQAPPYR